MSADAYFDAVENALRQAREGRREALDHAASRIVKTIQAGGILWVFGSAHSSIMAQELFYRAGGLVPVNPLFAPGLTTDVRPITMTSELERQEGYGRALVQESDIRPEDTLIVASVSGRNAVPIDVALAAKEKGATVIALTSIPYSSSVSSRHSSGLRLFEIPLDGVLDVGGIPGDAAVAVPGVPVRSGPTSTVVALYMLNGLIVDVVGRLAADGDCPPVFLSSNVDGGDRHNKALLAQHRSRLTYL